MDKQSIKIYVDNQLVGSAGYLDDFNKYGNLSDYLWLGSKSEVFAYMCIKQGKVDDYSHMKYFGSYPNYKKYPWRKIRRTICHNFYSKKNKDNFKNYGSYYPIV